MTENQAQEPERSPGDIMFICGAQATADGDLLPGAFTIFPVHYDEMQMANALMEKIMVDVRELGMETGNGQIVLMGICDWEEFASIDLDKHVKMQALVTAVTVNLLEAHLRHADKVVQIASVPWVPSEHLN